MFLVKTRLCLILSFGLLLLVRVWRMFGELKAEQTVFPTEKTGNRDFWEERKGFFAYFPELPENIAYSALELIL